MDEKEMEAFRLRYQVALIERLVLKISFLAPIMSGGLSAAQSQKTLNDWLDLNSEEALRAYGASFQEPAQTALYADEVNAITEKMKKIVEQLANEWQALKG